LAPDHLTYPAAVLANIDPRSDLEQPDRQPAPKPGWCVLNHDDQHRRSPLAPRTRPASPREGRPASADHPRPAPPRSAGLTGPRHSLDGMHRGSGDAPPPRRQ